MRLGIDSDAIPTRVRRDSDPSPTGGTRPNARARLIIVMRVIVYGHSAVFFRPEFIILRAIHLDFLRLVDEKPEIIPELVLVPDTFRHNMTQLVKCDECERIFVDEFIPFFGRVDAKRELLALVLTIRGILARRERLAYFIGAEVFD